jgi:hypothetical protein
LRMKKLAASRAIVCKVSDFHMPEY